MLQKFLLPFCSDEAALAELSVCLSWLPRVRRPAAGAEAALQVCCLGAAAVASRRRARAQALSQQSSTGAPSLCLQAPGPQASVAAVGAGAQAQEWWCAASLLCRVGSSPGDQGSHVYPRYSRWLLSTALPGSLLFCVS